MTATHALSFFRVLKARSHITDARGSHGQRVENWRKFVILASALSFARCASSCVTHSSSALDQRYTFVVERRHSLCASRFFVHAQNCALSSTHGPTRREVASHAHSTPDQRQTSAECTVCIRCEYGGRGIANAQRTSSAKAAWFKRMASDHVAHKGALNEC